MKKLPSIFLLFLFAWASAFGAVNKRNGVSITTSSTINGKTPNSAVNGQTVVSGLQPEVIVWAAGIASAGGTLTGNSQTYANNLMVQLNSESYRSGIIYLLPFLGADIIAARMPLIDSLGVGISTNSGFVNADFSESTGLQGATGKFLNTLFKMSQLNATDQKGGIGVWELSTTRAGDGYIMGSSGATNTNFYALELAGVQVYYWGDSGASRFTGSGGLNTPGFHLGQRTATNSLKYYYNSNTPVVNSSTYTPAQLGDRDVYVGAVNWVSGTLYGLRRIGLAIATDGTLSDADVIDLYNNLNTYLITPTGR